LQLELAGGQLELELAHSLIN